MIDPDLVVDQEIERIEEDREEKHDKQIEEGEIKLEADLQACRRSRSRPQRAWPIR